MSWLFPPVVPSSGTSFNYAPAGGVILAGALSALALVHAPTPSGGVIVSGTRTVAVAYVYAPITADIRVAGSATLSVVNPYTAVTSDIKLAGSAASSVVNVSAANSLGARMLEHIVNVAAPENLRLRVFKNNITPASTMTVADYTEATFTGYLAVTLTSADWTITHDGTYAFATASSGVMFASSATTDETVYGYYMTGVDSSTLYWAQAFPAAFRVYNLGDAVVPTSALQLGML